MAEAHKRAYRHPKYKTSYRVKNWPEYEQSLRNRGEITVWFSRDAINTWIPPKNGKRGGQPIYSGIAIETSLMLRLVFHLPLRQAEGFLRSIFKLISETFILRRSGAKDGLSGNVSLDTICRVTRKTHSVVTRESLMDG
jgi:hypothetical protein